MGEQEILLHEYMEILESLRFTISNMYVALNVFLVTNAALFSAVSFAYLSAKFSRNVSARSIYVIVIAVIGFLTSASSIIIGYRMALYVIDMSDRGIEIEKRIPVRLISIVRTQWDSGSGIFDAVNVIAILFALIGIAWGALALFQIREANRLKSNAGKDPMPRISVE